VAVMLVTGAGLWGLPSRAADVVMAAEDRVAGVDRYQTSVEVARQVGGGSLSGLDRLIVVSGELFPDGLAASGLAGFLDDGGRRGRTAILLSRHDELPEVTADAIRASGVPASQVLVVGGAAAVAESVRAVIAAAAGWNGGGVNPVTRIGGANRYETAAAIVAYVLDTAGEDLPDSYRTVLVASGENFPDGLSAGTLAYRNGHLLLLSPSSSLPPTSRSAVEGLNANCAVLIGGTRALSTRVAGEVDEALVSGECGVERIAGANRYETAALVADSFVARNGAPRRVTLISGVEFAEGLTSAPLGGGNQPLLLTATDQLHAAISAWLTQHRNSLTQLLVIGGTTAISPTVVDQANQTLMRPTTPPGPTPPTTTLPPVVPSWAISGGGNGRDGVFGISRFADGSAIVTGQFAGTATFGATTLISAGFLDVFVAKIGADGTWVWATSVGGTDTDLGRGVSVLADGSAIVTGRFGATATFGATTLITAGLSDVFVAKIDADGTWMWATSAFGAVSEISEGMSVLADGSAIITGYFSGAATFGATTLISAGLSDVFVAKIDAGGTWVWAKSAGGTSSDVGWGVSALADGSAIITGYFSGAATFGATTLISVDRGDVFVAKVGADGAWMWATSAFGADGDSGYGVSVLADGSAIVTGQFQVTLTFGATMLISAGSSDVFVAKVDAGGAWVWATSAGGTESDSGNAVSVLADGSAIVTGHFSGTATFGATTLISAGGADVLVAKIAADGTRVWATSAGGTGNDFGRGVSVLADGSTIVIGSFEGAATFGATTLISAGGEDLFIAKIAADGSFG
jgi:putative cell wall-binding protein